MFEGLSKQLVTNVPKFFNCKLENMPHKEKINNFKWDYKYKKVMQNDWLIISTDPSNQLWIYKKNNNDNNDTQVRLSYQT